MRENASLELGQGITDEEILMRSRTQPWLFSLLLDRHQDAFLRKARSILRDERDAEEVVQDAFVKMYTNAHTFEVREGAKFTSWAYTILINLACTRYRKCMKEGERFMQLESEAWTLIGDHLHHIAFDEDRDVVERILIQMPEHLSEPLRLHFLERWSQKDIAEINSEDVGAVKTRIHRAKQVFLKLARNQNE